MHAAKYMPELRLSLANQSLTYTSRKPYKFQKQDKTFEFDLNIPIPLPKHLAQLDIKFMSSPAAPHAQSPGHFQTLHQLLCQGYTLNTLEPSVLVLTKGLTKQEEAQVISELKAVCFEAAHQALCDVTVYELEGQQRKFFNEVIFNSTSQVFEVLQAIYYNDPENPQRFQEAQSKIVEFMEVLLSPSPYALH